MPRLSMWRENHTNDYKFFDKRISEEFVVGGTGILLHKYLGPLASANAYPLTSTISSGNTLTFANVAGFEVGQTVQGINIVANAVITSTNVSANSVTISSNVTASISSGTPVSVFWRDATQPNYTSASVLNIQDLLFLENRDRKYDTSVYVMRGIYTVSDNDWDLSQFGLMLSSDTIVLTFHLNDTVAMIGRKLMSGDVIELQHKKDYFPLNAEIPAVLKRFYVVQDVTFAAEGFSQTWWPHLIRIKAIPMVNSQEYKDILNNISSGDSNDTPIGQIMTNFAKLNEINDAIITQAQIDVPKSGYDTDTLYVEPERDSEGVMGPGDPLGTFTDNTELTTDSTVTLTDSAQVTPNTTIPAYLGGDGVAPDGWPVTASTGFPVQPRVGDYVLRTDYIPNRLFRFDGRRWTKIEDAVRTDLTPGPNNQTQRSKFVNETGTFVNTEGQTQPVRQSLSKALTPRADN
jgi:hypothetical protein